MLQRERQSYKTLKYADMQLLCRSLIIANRVYNLAKQPWSLTIINLASSTPPRPFCLNNSPLTFPPSCPLFHYHHNLWLTSLSPTTSSLCWVSDQLFSLPRWADRGGKTLLQTNRQCSGLISLKRCFKGQCFRCTEPFSATRQEWWIYNCLSDGIRSTAWPEKNYKEHPSN